MRDDVLAALADPATHLPGVTSVERHETHGSWVFVAGERVLKVKKPVVLPFLDYGTFERRRALCREEVRLNRRLAPELYLGTVGIVPATNGAGWRLDADDEADGAVEVAVVMRRYDEVTTLAAQCASGIATPVQLRAVGERIAAFHAQQQRPDRAGAALDALRAATRTTLDALEDEVGRVRIAVLRTTLEAGLSARREELVDRGRRGLVVDGHGDLRAEHVLLTEPIQIVDALEFDPSLRVADVSCDLGFLVMELEGMGRRELVAALLDGYREAGGDPGDDRLVALMASYRALVRAKVDLVRGGQGDSAAAARAERRVSLAERLAWRVRGARLIAVCGSPATGKSTLATALSSQSGMVHLSSDVVRKEQAGLAPTDRASARAYSRDASLRTYRELGRRAAAALRGDSVGAVVDATLGDADARVAFRTGLGLVADELRYVECRVPAAEVKRRAAARELDPARESDATADIAARLATAWMPLDEAPAERHLVLRTDRAVATIISDVAAWLDRSWA